MHWFRVLGNFDMPILQTNSRVIGSASHRYAILDVAFYPVEHIGIEFYTRLKIVDRLSQHVAGQYFLLFRTKAFKDEFLKVLSQEHCPTSCPNSSHAFSDFK